MGAGVGHGGDHLCNGIDRSGGGLGSHLLILGATWVLVLLQVVVLGSACVSASSSKMAPWNSAHTWATVVRQSYAVPFCKPLPLFLFLPILCS